jgi:hypothetical protein
LLEAALAAAHHLLAQLMAVAVVQVALGWFQQLRLQLLHTQLRLVLAALELQMTGIAEVQVVHFPILPLVVVAAAQ